MDIVLTKPGIQRESGGLSHRAFVYFACTTITLITNYFLGKEMSWDMLNYHVYAGFSGVNNRFSQDFFAAGPQSYFNPYAYVPFYLLSTSGLSSLTVSSILAAIHSIIFWLTFELAMCAVPTSDGRMRTSIGICAVTMAFVNPVLIQQLGSSFADITTGELVLAGWVLLASAVRAPQIWKVTAAGLLLGAATALKLTNSVHAIAATVFLGFLPLLPGRKLTFSARYFLCTSLGFVVVAAPWSYKLEQKFGNPFFPLLNNLFHSPFFTEEPLRHLRFVPPTIGEALWRPFAMIDPQRMVHEELSAPDPRYAVLVVIAGALLAGWLWRRHLPAARKVIDVHPADSTRTVLAIGCAFTLDWVIWLKESGNSRYFLPLSCVAAVLTVALLFKLLRDLPKARNYVLLAIFASQALQLSLGAEFRWKAAPWDRRWFNIDVPQELKSDPNLFLTIGMQSDSFIAPYLANSAGLVNFSGSYTPLSPGNASGAEVEALVRRFSPNIRMLMRGKRLYQDDEGHGPRRLQVDGALARFGLRVDPQACQTISVHGLTPELEVTSNRPALDDVQLFDTTFLISCLVVPDARARAALDARQRAVDIALDRLEDACPQLLQPRGSGTEIDGNTWHRRYMNTDLKASVLNARINIRDPLRADSLIYEGDVSDWSIEPPALVCGKGPSGYFAKTIK